MNQALRDEKRICFITCVNDERKYEMCLARLKQLLLPENMRAEYIAVRQAKSMCAGYQQAMLMSNAKYKVYLHQDVLILDDSFVLRLLELFTNNKLCGIAGVVGSSNIPKEAVWWQRSTMCRGVLIYLMAGISMMCQLAWNLGAGAIGRQQSASLKQAVPIYAVELL